MARFMRMSISFLHQMVNVVKLVKHGEHKTKSYTAPVLSPAAAASVLPY